LQSNSGNTQENILDKAAATATNIIPSNKQGDDIMSVLLAHEKKGGSSNIISSTKALPHKSSDSSDNEEDTEMQTVDTGMRNLLKIYKNMLTLGLLNQIQSNIKMKIT